MALSKLGWLLLAASLNAAADAYNDPYGEWRGQAQYQATIGGNVDSNAHSVTNLTISIDPQGKVVGASAGNGCRLLGVASPGVVKNILQLDITFKGCQYASFNRRFSGTLALYSSQQYATLRLGTHIVRPGQAMTYDIKATMRR